MEFFQGSRDNVNVLYFCHTGLTILNRILGSSAYHESRTSENSRFAANICVFYDIRFNVPNVETNVVKYISSCSRKECSVRKMCSRNNHTNSHGIRCASVCYASSTCKASSVNEQTISKQFINLSDVTKKSENRHHGAAHGITLYTILIISQYSD